VLSLSLYGYLYFKLAKKCCIFLIISYVFSSTISEKKRAEQVLPGSEGKEGGGGPSNIYTCK
jgi:hypothetical protein